MKRIVIIMIMVCTMAVPLIGNEYYVAVDGSDRNPGSQELPFLTIQKAADVMIQGDICYVREGTYRETVIPKNSGASGMPIQFCAYPGEVVTLSGTIPVTGKWSVHEGSIYKTKVDIDFIQLFVDGKMMIEARWPNARFEDMLNRDTWAASDKGSRYGKMVDAELAKTGIDWTGALATLNVAHQFFTWTRTVNKHSKGSDTFEYARDMGALAEKQAKNPAGWEDDRYFLSGKVEALDTPTEWCLDTETQILYLWTSDGGSPENHKVEAKVRDFAFDIEDRYYIEITGFHFFGTTFNFENCHYCIIDRCHLLFPTYTNRITELDAVRKPTVMTLITGTHNIVRNSSLAYSPTQGFMVRGNNNIIDNNLVHDFCWVGSLTYTGIKAAPASGDKLGAGCIIRGNTVFNAGNVCIHFFNMPGTVCEYNHVHHGGFQCKDVALIYTQRPRYCRFGNTL